MLARESGHPEGDNEVAYIFVAPLDAEGRIEPKLWRAHREACRALGSVRNRTNWVISFIGRGVVGIPL